MMATIQIEANIVWNVKPTGSGTMMGVCDPLGLTLEADDASGLQGMIAESLHYLFLGLFEDGELDRFLLDRGWSAHGIPQIRPQDGAILFQVPFTTHSAAA